MVTLDPFFAGRNYYCEKKMPLKKNKNVLVGFQFFGRSVKAFGVYFEKAHKGCKMGVSHIFVLQSQRG